MNKTQTMGAIALLLLSASTQAARPTSIVFETLAKTEDGVPYAQFTVRCNDGKTVPLTAWDNRRRWCIGETANGSCQNKQISAAKAACDEPPVTTTAGAVASVYSR
jgi:hypothetical protein